MYNLKVGTWDIKNSYFNISKNYPKAKAIRELIEKKDLDVLALQEVNGNLFKQINEELKGSDYHLDRYFESGMTNLPDFIGEHNVTVIKNRFLNNCDTLRLASFPHEFRLTDLTGIRFRYVNRILLKEEKSCGNHFCLLNTQIDPRGNIAAKQIESLGNYIAESSRLFPTIVVGNLNIMPQTIAMGRLKYFTLNDNQLKLIDVGERTYQGHKEDFPVDYIIVPKDTKVEETEVVKEYRDISSHYPVLAKLTVR